MKIKHLLENKNNVDTFKEYINGEFSEAYNAYKNDCIIYKGLFIDDIDTFDLMHPIQNRKSVNTSNIYTLWMNNSEEWKEYPHRNVICSNSPIYASGYGTVYIIFPRNGSKIGICPHNDIWDSFHVFNPTIKTRWSNSVNDLVSLVLKNFS